MTDDRIIREEIVHPAIERIIAELPRPITTVELISIIGGIVDAYGIEGVDAKAFFNAMANHSEEVNAAKHAHQAINQMTGRYDD